MRDRWLRFLLLSRQMPSSPLISRVHHCRTPLLRPSVALVNQRASFSSLRHFCSSPEIVNETAKDVLDQTVLLNDIFAETERSDDEIKEALDLKNICITHELILGFLQSSITNLDVARRVFYWVSRNQGEKLSSKSYNWMLGILGSNGVAKDVWEMIALMKSKGYGVSKGAYDRILEKFQTDGLDNDVEKLRNLYSSGSVSCKNNDVGSAPGKLAYGVTELIRREIWGDHVEKQLSDLNVEFSTGLVAKVLGGLQSDTNKAVIFFRWLQESGTFVHDQGTYNTIARILSREDHSQKFWSLCSEMRSKGYELEKETYIHLLQQFIQRKMLKDAVDLYEFSMAGTDKPSTRDCTFLLKKIVVSKELDMELFKRVIRCFTSNGNSLTDAHLSAVIKSLVSVGKLMTEWDPILSAMEEAGYSRSSWGNHELSFELCRHDKSGKLLDNGHYSPGDHGTWHSAIEGYCSSGNMAGACNCFRLMLKKEGVEVAGYGRLLDLLVTTFCTKSTSLRGYDFISEMVNEKGLRPSHTAYKTLISKLLSKLHLKEALANMSMMKAHGYPPSLDLFMNYLSRQGSPEDAVNFTKALTSKKLPATSIYIQLLSQYIAAGRISEAQELLSKCPKYIRNHGDVLNVFCSNQI